MSKSTNETEISDIDPYLKEQNEGILYAFAKEDNRVLTTPEIEEHVDIGRRQVDRRLKSLRDKGIVGTRKPGRTRLWWLESEVEEPASVQYPIVKLIREKLSLQFIVIGVLLGIVSAILSTAGVIANSNNITILMIDSGMIFHATLLSGLLAVMFFITGGSIAGTVWLFKYMGIEIRYKGES
ncbi:hypothetical protein [Halorhabdus salina]|uniref:hypothetical protein n=1 Tax=Halorhabdus salina TaxID=2750670 RepID=UPI0015EF99B7|nr:hypothetical protein [Halorhabdus salina]